MGTFNLDDEPDVREVLLLSDEFKLDEIVALLCVEAARQEVRCRTPRAGPAGQRAALTAARISATCPTPPAARARAQRNEVSAADAAGVYFEERRSLLVSLWMLLQAQVGPPPARLPGQAQATSVRSTQRFA